MILDWSMDSDEYNEVWTSMSLGSYDCCCALTGLGLNEVGRAYKVNVCVISPVLFTFKLDIVLVGLLEISYYIPFMTFTVMEPY